MKSQSLEITTVYEGKWVYYHCDMFTCVNYSIQVSKHYISANFGTKNTFNMTTIHTQDGNGCSLKVRSDGERCVNFSIRANLTPGGFVFICPQQPMYQLYRHHTWGGWNCSSLCNLPPVALLFLLFCTHTFFKISTFMVFVSLHLLACCHRLCIQSHCL